MKHSRKLTILALAVAMVSAMLVTTSVAVGQTGGGVYVDRGVLLLHTGDDGFRVDWYEYASPGVLKGTPSATQTLNVDERCNVTPSGPELISITPAGGNGKIGGVSHGLGVKNKNTCSTAEGLIEDGESLTFALGASFDESFWVLFAELDVEGKRSAELGVRYDGGFTEIIVLNNTSSDNGPDSGTGDNNVAVVAHDYFRAVEFFPVGTRTTSPAVAIEGGGDGTVTGPPGSLRSSLGTNDSLFDLYQEFDGELACGQGVTEGGTEGNAKITVFRDFQALCELKPYNLDALGSTASFEPTGQANAEFTALIVWPAENAVLPVPVTQVDFGLGGGLEDVQWCTGSATRDTNGLLSLDSDGQFVDPPELPADGAPWCVLDQDVTYVNGGQAQLTEYYYGTGDPRFGRS